MKAQVLLCIPTQQLSLRALARHKLDRHFVVNEILMTRCGDIKFETATPQEYACA